MIAGMVLTNLLYLFGAIVATAVVSGFVVLRHRRPRSLEAGIEMFSRELKALEPERHVAAAGRAMPPTADAPVVAAETTGRNEARAPLPDQENEPG